MTFLGADTDQVRDQGERTNDGAGRLDELISALRGAIARTTWEGPDAVSFRDRAQVTFDEATGTGDALRARADELRAHAEEQDQASGDGPGSGGPGAEEEGSGKKVVDDGDAEGTEPLEEDIPLEGEDTQLENTGQGGIADCFLLATVGTIAQQDPDFLEEHIEEVEDGVYRVTLYDEDGNEIHYIVESTPENGARLDEDGEAGGHSVYSIYERAYQMHLESLGEDDPLNFGNRVDALQTITGQEASSYSGEDTPPIEDLHQLLGNDRPVTAGTGGQNEPAHPEIAGQHAYKVSEVDVEAGTVTVVNPWFGNESVTMTYDEYVETFTSTAVGRTQPPSMGDRIGELFDGTGSY
ncbi:WXG100 family type VII secretion target [Brachybacterium sp. AOP43-C2-M15]|uniref:WXG100 family type VII secretion target n=1 Tax=Brachybacterium sp. AOP43-C2-M15 TaxID=3457661 RepID=UPI0040346715